MNRIRSNSKWIWRATLMMAALTCLVIVSPLGLQADKKKKKNAAEPPKTADYSHIVWPNPPGHRADRVHGVVRVRQSGAEYAGDQPEKIRVDGPPGRHTIGR